MKKYRIKVEMTKEYEIEVDESKITEEYLDGWEKVFWKLDEEEDRHMSLAHDFGRMRAYYGEEFIEGFGYVLEKGEKPLSAVLKNVQCNEGINLTKIDEDSEPYVEVEEIPC